MKSFSILAAAAAMALVGVCPSTQAATAPTWGVAPTQGVVLTNVRFAYDYNSTGGAYVGATDVDPWNLFQMGIYGFEVIDRSLYDPAGAWDYGELLLTLNVNSDRDGGTGGEFLPDPYTKLMNGALYVKSGKVDTITVSGLSPNIAYDLYAFSQGERGCTGRQLGLNVNGTDYITTPAVASATTFIKNQNYMEIPFISDASGNLTMLVSGQGADPNQEGDLNGFQIVAVPEPMSLGILGLGAAALLRRRRAAKA